MLHEQLRNAWRGRERAIPISPELHFAPHGLVLGAGTVLIAADGPHRLTKLGGQEARVLALLAAAYDRPIAPRVLGNIERAAKAWSEGDDCLAYIHLAHAGLPALRDPYEAARRLFMADGFMKAGTPPRDIVEALGLGGAFADTLEKFYNEQEPRVPKGSGRPSGEWTRLFSFLADLSEPAAKELGRWGLRLVGGAVAAALTPEAVAVVGGAAAFGLIFIPSNKSTRVDGEVSGLPGLRYSWNRDETQLRLFYTRAAGDRLAFTAKLEDDVFRDPQGRIVGRLLPGDIITVDPRAFPGIPANENEPRLCPLPGLDKPGEKGRDYEDYVKKIINPIDTTPRYWGFQLPNPENGWRLVHYDDCQHSTGMMVEAKGPGYDKLLGYTWGKRAVAAQFIDQSLRQVQASGGRHIRWYFAELKTALFAQELFRKMDSGRDRIEIAYLPWLENGQ